MTWRDDAAEQNIRLANKMLDQQGEINQLKADLATALAELAAARAATREHDRMENQVLAERDDYEQVADRLAAAIAAMTGEEIGEHSSMNDPWANALDAAARAARTGVER